MSKVSLKDVAKAMDMSVSTISRSLNNKGEVDPETSKRVQQKAKEMGYVPNYAARSLKGKHSHLIGVIIDDNTNPFYAEVLKGMESEVQKKGYQLLLVNTHNSLTHQGDAVEILQNRGVDGILVAPVRDTDPSDLSAVRVPFVVVGRHFENADFHEVYNDDEQGGYLATKHLLSLKRKKILHIRSRLDLFPSRARLRGYEKALEEEGIDIQWVLDIQGQPEEIHRKLPPFLESHQVDGIFTFNDLFAMEALLCLKESKIKVPEEIAVVGYDNIPYAAYTFPALTSMALDEMWIGKKSVQQLIAQLEKRKLRKKQWIQQPSLCVRESA